jgi:hypothetical protein
MRPSEELAGAVCPGLRSSSLGATAALVTFCVAHLIGARVS